MPEQLLKDKRLQDSDNLDALLDLAAVVRRLVSEQRCSDINRIIVHTVENSYDQAFLWTVSILQEEFEKQDCTLQDFCCNLGGRIADYDSFVDTLQVVPEAVKNEIKKIYDKNGEVESFFNVIVYRTAFPNVFLVSEENFDTRDNDFIRYRLDFAKKTTI